MGVDSGPAPEIRSLDPDDIPALLQLRRLAFNLREDPENPAVRARMQERLPYLRGAFLGRRLAAAAATYPLPMYLAGREVPMGGLAGVVSAPEHRRRGLVRSLVRDALERLRRAGVGWCLEHPFDPRFYARFGFQSIPHGRSLTLPVDILFSGRGPEATLLEGGPGKPMLEIHRSFAGRFSFPLTRRGGIERWRPLFRPPWQEAERFGYVLEDAYLVGEIRQVGERTRLEVVDLGWSTPRGRAGLLRFAGSFQGQVQEIRLYLPEGDPLVADWGTAFASRLGALQARIADLGPALAPLQDPSGEGATPVVLELEDTFCPWNAGRWRIHPAPDGTSVEPSSEAPAAGLDTQALVSLLAGTAPEDLVADGRAWGSPKGLRRLSRLTGGHPPFLPQSDHF